MATVNKYGQMLVQTLIWVLYAGSLLFLIVLWAMFVYGFVLGILGQRVSAYMLV